MVITLSDDEERMLSRFAAAQNLTPRQALDQLLSSPVPQRRRWTPDELEMLRNPANSPRSLAKALNRSANAISVRRALLRKEDATDATTHQA